MLDSQKDSFSSKQEANANSFRSIVEQINAKSTEIEQRASTQAQELREAGVQLIDDNRKLFEEYQEQVKNIVGIVNTNMFSHKYKSVADDAKDRARTWHWIAVILMILVSGFAVYAFVITTNESTGWVKLVSKIFATTTLITGAAYAARQASKQEKVERYARKIEMELVAIDPFIESLEEDQRKSIKGEIARRIFGNSDTMELTGKDEANIKLGKFATIEDITKLVISLNNLSK